ncbi:MAG: hypothetical protein JNM97_22340 [Rhodoferax sp.]|nr:hypothetical protein [Rhodoferax sp.]
MTAEAILIDLWRDSISVRLTPDGEHLAVFGGRLTTEQRTRVLENKPDLIAYLHAAHGTTERLLVAAMKVCDQHGDNDAARQDMREQCLELPPHLQADLLEHFTGKRHNFTKG